MDLMNLMVRIGADTKGAEKGIKTVSKMGDTLAKGLKTAAKGAGIALGAAATAVGFLTKSAIDAYARYEQLVGGVETLYKTSADKVQTYAKQAYKTAGMSANDYMEQTTSFAAALVKSLGGDTEKAADMADMAISDMSDNVNKMGSSMESVQNAYAGFAKGNYTMLDNLKLGYGGTKEEMEKLLKQAEAIEKQQGRSTKYSINSYADIVQAIHVVQGEMGITGTTVAEADKTIQGSLAATKAAWENVITAIGGGNLDLQDSISALVESGINTINNIWPVVSSALSGIAEMVKQVAPIIAENLPGMVQEILPKLLDAAITLLGGVASALPGLFQVVLDAIGTLFVNIKTYIDKRNPELGKKIDKIATFFVNAWNAIKDYWNSTLKPTLSNISVFITDTVVPAITKAWQEFQPKIEAVFTAIKGFWNDMLKPALSAMWTWITTIMLPAVRQAWQDVQPKIEAVFVAIKGFWNDTLKPVLSAMWTWLSTVMLPAVRAAWEAIQPKIEAVFVAIKGFWEETLQPVLSTMWTWISETMLPAVSEAWEAIQPKIEAVFVAIQGFWETILKPAFEAIKAFLEETLGPIFENTFNAIKEVVDSRLQAIKDLWENAVKPIYEGIVEFFSGVFSGNWEEAWNGIQAIVQGVWDAIQIAAETIWEDAKTWGATIIENFKVAFTNAWDLVSADVLGIWDNITNKVEEIWTAALEWGKTIFDNFKTSIQEGWNNISQWFSNLWDEIKAIPQKFVDSALNWGKDLIDNFKQGIDNAWQGLKDKVSDVGQSIKNFLGFSKPKEGPLSDFDTYAPDMMDLFVKGINDNMHTITTALSNMVSNVKAAFKLAGEGGYKEFDQGLNGYWGNQLIDVIKNPMQDAYNQAWNIEWWKLGEHIYNSVAFYCDWIRDKFKNTFDFSNMYVKTPHWWVDSWYEISGTYYPNMSVHWYRKAYDNPVMFTSPTVLGTANGLKGFGDGPGGEIVLSEDKLRSIVGGAGDTYNTINVYQREGENMDSFVRRIEEIMARHESQRKAAFA